MRFVFLLVGLLLILGGLLEGFIQPWGPTPTEIMAMLLVIGGLALLGISQILQAIAQRRV